MLSLFNPWVLLAILIAICSSFGGGYYKGGQDEFAKQQMEIARLNAAARQKEQALVSAVTIQSTKLMKANNDAKLQTQKLYSSIDSGALRLRVAVKASECAVHASSDTASTSGNNSGIASTELDAETAKTLISITDEGDIAIRKLATCISLYNEARETLKVKP